MRAPQRSARTGKGTRPIRLSTQQIAQTDYNLSLEAVELLDLGFGQSNKWSGLDPQIPLYLQA